MGPKGKLKTGVENKPTETKDCVPSGKPNTKVSVSVPVQATFQTDDDNNSEEALNTSKYSRRKLDKNWEKYEEQPETDSIPKGLNFSDFYEKKPTVSRSTDSYFRFSNEKNWEVSDTFDDYFKLNVNHLCREIMCAPLYERLKLSSCLLTTEQKDIFDNDAKRNQNKIKDPLTGSIEIEKKMLSLLGDESKPQETEGWSHGLSSSNTDKQSTWDSQSENFFSLSGVEEELDSILSSMPATAPVTIDSKKQTKI